MKRRKAIIGISLAGAGIVAAGAGYKWYSFPKKPYLQFVENQHELIVALAETMIPAIDTAGAKEVGVGDFIIKIIRDCSPVKTQNNFIDGLKDLHAYAQSEFHKLYPQCTKAKQENILSHFEKKGRSFNGIMGRVQYRLLGKSFFSI